MRRLIVAITCVVVVVGLGGGTNPSRSSTWCASAMSLGRFESTHSAPRSNAMTYELPPTWKYNVLLLAKNADSPTSATSPTLSPE